ncbi:UDP-N-acetyl-D-glucosamine 6-dehydrogenase [Candidatus Zixiibacteriota bacterium]|nr:UDP-N-acetyl-D-glucosamine 6-dehydrogenase [candidate division Zixibacteria bacterium]
MVNDLLKKFDKKTAKIGIMGLGYVGLPLAVEFAEAGFNVTGFEISEKKIKLINAGKSDIDDIPNDRVAPLVKAGLLTATGNPKLIKQMDAVSICVPTPLSKTKDPDVSFILSAMEWIKPNLHKGLLVVLESTTYPGTTDDLILPILQQSGLKIGQEIFLAFSPERVDPGNARFNTKNTPRVVGGITPHCTKAAQKYYQQILDDVYPLSSTKAAEMVKLLENTFRLVNIGLVNEVALMCDRLKLNVWEIIDAASTKPFGFMPFYPGPGLGGHCIPIDPHYLSWKLKSLNYYARFIELAGDINSHMPEYVIDRIRRVLNDQGRSIKGQKVLVLGIAYKKDIKDVRESPSLDVIHLLEMEGAKVIYNDPHVPQIIWKDGILKSTKLTADLLKKIDLAVIVTDHKAYDYQWIVDNTRLIFDTRNAAKKVQRGRKKITVL